MKPLQYVQKFLTDWRIVWSVLASVGISCLGCNQTVNGSLPFTKIAFSPDGKWLVAAGGTIGTKGGEGIVKVWDASTWKPHHTIKDGFSDDVDTVFFVDKSTLAVASKKILRGPTETAYDGIVIRSWKLQEKNELDAVHLKGARGWARSIDYFPAGELIAFTPWDFEQVGIFTFPKLEPKTSLKQHSRGSSMLRFSKDGKRILSCTRGETPELRLHDAKAGDRIAEHKLDSKNDASDPTEVRSAEFSGDGKLIAVGAINPDKIYVLTADLSVRVFAIEVDKTPECVVFDPASEIVAFCIGRASIQVYSIKTRRLVKSFDDNPEGPNCCCFSPDGIWIAVASGGHPLGAASPPSRVRVFEVKSGKLVAQLEELRAGIALITKTSVIARR